MRPELSIIIPVYDRAKELQTCLGTLRPHLDGLHSEIIIIDDASPDEGPKEIAASFGARYFKNDRRQGSAYSKNLGIDQSSGDILLFLDSDIELLDCTSLPEMIAVLKNTPFCGQVGGEAILDISGKVTHIFGRNIDERTGRSRSDYFDVRQYSSPIRYDYIPTSNCMVKRSDAARINGFDDYYAVLGEDKDFGYRLGRIGLHSYVIPNGVVLHHFATTARRDGQLDKQYRTQVRFCLRHYGIGTATIGLFRDELLAIRLRTKPEPIPKNSAIERFEQRYVTEILRVKNTKRGAHKRFDAILRLVRAIVWNVFHFKGIGREGSRSPL